LVSVDILESNVAVVTLQHGQKDDILDTELQHIVVDMSNNLGIHAKRSI
jgi:hypothetical protein